MTSVARESVAKNAQQIAKEFVGHFPAHNQLARRFLKTFQSNDAAVDKKFGKLKYMAALRQVANRNGETVWVELDDLEAWAQQQAAEPDAELLASLGVSRISLAASAEALVSAIEKDTTRYIRIFTEMAALEMPPKDEDANQAKTGIAKDTIDEWRRRIEQQASREGGSAANAQVPNRLKNAFDIRFQPRKRSPLLKLREIKADEVGSLVQMQVLVVRVSPVKPKLEIATYHCEVCEAEIFQEVDAETYTPLIQCQSAKCKDNQKMGKVSMRIRTSKFVRYQEVKVQEMSEHVPDGGVPRCLNVICQSDLTRQMVPGDAVSLTGIFRPVEMPGFVIRRRGHTNQDMYVEAHYIKKMKKGYSDDADDDDELNAAEVHKELHSGDLYGRASKSIAPEIYGHQDVKKALLLMLVGGTTKNMKDGMKIRGDIHTLLMGDPGVAKSQLLKQVCKIAPRSVFTTGKGASGVGLTASVVRDQVTGEVTLEGGALVLADMGVCCIDEFDKMEEGDRTAIHEVMEQQTVSLAKAGITTTLNSRTTVCAAANPAWGRYNPYKSPVENMAMPAALLSRFDFQFLLLDIVDREKDLNLAKHVTLVHSAKKELDKEAAEKGGDKMIINPETELQSDFKAFNHRQMRSYIRQAREVDPLVADSLRNDIADTYVAMRQEEVGQQDSRKAYTTPRQLLGLLRISMAVARTRFSKRVERQDFEEALRLMKASKESVEITKAARDGASTNPLDIIYDIVNELSQRSGVQDSDGWVEIQMVVARAGVKLLTEEMVGEALENWESLSVMVRNERKTHVKFLVPTQ